MNLPEKAKQRTFYFIGVTTAQSAIMKVFPLWAEVLGLGDAVIKGIDVTIQADPEDYREIVRFIKEDELSLGALVTTHKIDLLKASRGLFDRLDPYAEAFNEISCISKNNEKLEGYAKDPISSGLAMKEFTPDHYWKQNGEVFLMGAGGSAIAIASYLIKGDNGAGNMPVKIHVSDRSLERLDHMRDIISTISGSHTTFEYVLVDTADMNDSIMAGMPPHSLVINATGLGKDRPGSPLTDDARFPEESLIWELNYRGDLLFKQQAEKQRDSRCLTVHDGWVYFIHGWTQVIAEVFHIRIEPEQIVRLTKIASV
jgi:shikimate dehydrogenase